MPAPLRQVVHIGIALSFYVIRYNMADLGGAILPTEYLAFLSNVSESDPVCLPVFVSTSIRYTLQSHPVNRNGYIIKKITFWNFI